MMLTVCLSERTFLAWLRTSLSFASIGIAITQLFRLNTSLTKEADSGTLQQLGKPLGAIFLGISILMLFLGYHRYFQAQQWIIKGKFPASRGTVILVSLVALGLMVISLYVETALLRFPVLCVTFEADRKQCRGSFGSACYNRHMKAGWWDGKRGSKTCGTTFIFHEVIMKHAFITWVSRLI